MKQRQPVDFSRYGKELRAAGIYPMCFPVDWSTGERQVQFKYSAGWKELESYTGRNPAFTPNRNWNPTDQDRKDRELAVALELSGLICLDIDVKKCTRQLEGLDRDSTISLAMSLVPSEWIAPNGGYVEFTKSGGLHVIWRIPEILKELPEKALHQGIYAVLKSEFKLDSLMKYGDTFPDCIEIKKVGRIVIAPTYGYEVYSCPFGTDDGILTDLPALTAEPPQSFIDVVRANSTYVPKPIKPVARQRAQRSRRQGRTGNSIRDIKNAMSWSEIFSTAGLIKCLQTTRRGSGDFDCCCSSPYASDSTPSFYFQTTGEKKYHDFSTGKSGDIYDIYRDFVR